MDVGKTSWPHEDPSFLSDLQQLARYAMDVIHNHLATLQRDVHEKLTMIAHAFNANGKPSQGDDSYSGHILCVIAMPLYHSRSVTAEFMYRILNI